MRCGYEKLSLKLRDSEAENLIKLEAVCVPLILATLKALTAVGDKLKLNCAFLPPVTVKVGILSYCQTR